MNILKIIFSDMFKF